MITRLLISFFIFFFTINTFSQKKQTNEQYIEKYYKIAIEEMQKYKIPASITLAQGILESGSGNSDLAKKAKNHFGIKCHSSWKGKRYFMDDDEKDECFRVYKNPKSSFEDHSAFLTNRGRYEFLFTDYATTDYKKWAKGLKKAGYATNPKYPNLLIDLIERYHLYK
jgi:flagellum-specific peptidoglycan hydrolase FlgJ